jgi:hypothetical protein
MGTHLAATGTAVQAVHDALAAWRAAGDHYLRGLDDAAFVAAWAAVRHRMVPPHGPEPMVKRLYDAMHAEFLRRACGWSRLTPGTQQRRP